VEETTDSIDMGVEETIDSKGEWESQGLKTSASFAEELVTGLETAQKEMDRESEAGSASSARKEAISLRDVLTGKFLHA
jgi:hypothetical protein